MSTGRRLRKTTIGGAFAPRTVEMLESPPYSVLSLSGHRVLARIEIELAQHGGKENHSLPITFDDFERYGIHRHAIAPGIRETVALGFVTWKRGSAGNAEYRRPSVFGLTYRHSDYAEPTHDWRRFKTTAEAWTVARMAASRPTKKQNPSGGKRRVSVAETTTETPTVPVVETTTTAIVRKPPLLSISREGATPAGASERAAIKASEATTTHHASGDLSPVASAANSIIKKIRPVAAVKLSGNGHSESVGRAKRLAESPTAVSKQNAPTGTVGLPGGPSIGDGTRGGAA